MAEFHQTIRLTEGQTTGITIEQIDPCADSRWDVLVDTHSDKTIFHYSAWARVLVEAYGHRPLYLRISIDGVEVALVPLMEVKSLLTGSRGVSLPFSDFAGPLWRDPNQAHAVYAALLELATSRQWKHLEIRGGFIPIPGIRPFQTYGGHLLNLRPGPQVLLQNLDPSVRRAIRKAESGDIQVTVERNSEAMNEFYILHGRTRRRHGLPPQPHQFFDAISKHLVAHNCGSIVLAKLAGVPIAGAVFLHSSKRAIYKFGASDAQYWPLRPNQGVMWSAIRELMKIGCEELHFGRTSPADEGLARFKLSWGSIFQPLSYYRHHFQTGAWVSADGHPSESYPLIFGHLPIACNRLAGGLIYPHLD